jgi:cyclophilin family peptidyl-prolyl cis-trans isomerase
MKQIKILLLMSALLFPALSQAKKPDTRALVSIETSMGTIKVALYDGTPIHRDNFLKLVSSGFYNGLLFHRVIRDFMIQAGDPNSKGAPQGKQLGDGDLPYTLPAEIRIPDYYHHRGALAMAREGDNVNPERRSSAAQFYIVYGQRQSERTLAAAQASIDRATDGTVKMSPEMRNDYLTTGGTPHLDGQYTVFGEVVEGMDVVKRIQTVKTDANDRPQQDVTIIRATVLRQPAPATKKKK